MCYRKLLVLCSEHILTRSGVTTNRIHVKIRIRKSQIRLIRRFVSSRVFELHGLINGCIWIGIHPKFCQVIRLGMEKYKIHGSGVVGTQPPIGHAPVMRRLMGQDLDGDGGAETLWPDAFYIMEHPGECPNTSVGPAGPAPPAGPVAPEPLLPGDC